MAAQNDSQDTATVVGDSSSGGPTTPTEAAMICIIFFTMIDRANLL